MSIFKQKTIRRREVRRVIQAGSRSIWMRLKEGRTLLGIGFLAAYLVVAGLIVVDTRLDPPQSVGQLAGRTFIARVSFDSNDPVKTEENRQFAAERVPGVYTPNENFLKGTEEKLKNLPVVAATVEFANLSE